MWLCALQSQQYLCREVKQERPWNAVHDVQCYCTIILYMITFMSGYSRASIYRTAQGRLAASRSASNAGSTSITHPAQADQCIRVRENIMGTTSLN